jgi:hypothetical protein
MNVSSGGDRPRILDAVHNARAAANTRTLTADELLLGGSGGLEE